MITDSSPIPVGVTGCIARDYSMSPMRNTMPPSRIKRIPRSEWPDRIADMERNKSRLSDIRKDMGPNGSMMPSLNQGQWGYCWAHGPVAAAMLLRAKAGLPYLAFSAFGVAYTIKKGKDEGAWGALAQEFITNRGMPLESDWPRFERRLRPDNDPIWDTAALYKFTDGFAEAASPVWDRDLSLDEVMSCLLSNIPVCCDFMWWGHHVVAMDPIYKNGQYGVRIWNSWGDTWGENGEQDIIGQRAIPDNATAPLWVSN